MDPEFGTRLIVAVMITGVGLILFNLVNKYNLARNHGKITLFPGYRPGVPAILYFTAPTCVPCKTVQRPALKKLKDVLGERIQILEVDASPNADLVATWVVLSVPTTYIFDDEGNPRHVNRQARPDQIALRGRLGLETELEALYILGQFGIDRKRKGRVGQHTGQVFEAYEASFSLGATVERLSARVLPGGLAYDLTAQGFSNYAGRLSIQKSLYLPENGREDEQVWLVFENLHAAVVHVRIKRAGLRQPGLETTPPGCQWDSQDR